MTAITRAQKVYFAAVGSFALWVGIWGTFVPTEVARALPWQVPPLHARFLGAVYFSAAVLLFGGMLARWYAEVRAMVPVISVWTGMLLVVSLFHLDQFDFHHKPVWFWFFAYILYPVLGFWWIWRHRGQDERVAGPALPPWTGGCFRALGTVLVLLALAMLLAPQLVVTVWPWKITPLLVQIYSAPFLAYGLASFMLARQKTWPEVRLVVVGLLVFVSMVLVASILHRGLFTPGRPATWVWFGGFFAAVALLGGMVLRFPRRGVAS